MSIAVPCTLNLSDKSKTNIKLACEIGTIFRKALNQNEIKQ